TRSARRSTRRRSCWRRSAGSSSWREHAWPDRRRASRIEYRRGVRRLALVLVAAAACGGGTDRSFHPTPPPDCTAKPGTALKLTQVASGLRNPVWVTAPAGDPRVFVIEQPGVIRVIRDGALVDAPYLDLQDRVNATGDEQGLLGLAFHPRFAENG